MWGLSVDGDRWDRDGRPSSLQLYAHAVVETDPERTSRWVSGPVFVAGDLLGTVGAVHIELMAIIVDDYDTAIEFFVGALGFELVEDAPSTTNDGRPKRWVVVRPPGATTGVLLAQADGPRQAERVGDQTAGRVGWFLRVDDFDETHRRMVDRGVEFVTEPRLDVYGKVAVFLDVSGNRWDLLGS